MEALSRKRDSSMKVIQVLKELTDRSNPDIKSWAERVQGFEMGLRFSLLTPEYAQKLTHLLYESHDLEVKNKVKLFDVKAADVVIRFPLENHD